MLELKYMYLPNITKNLLAENQDIDMRELELKLDTLHSRGIISNKEEWEYGGDDIWKIDFYLKGTPLKYLIKSKQLHTICIRGHDMMGESEMIAIRSNGKRYCKQCKRIRTQKRRHAKRGKTKI